MHVARSKNHEYHDGRDLEQHHDVIGVRRFADAAHEDDGEQHHNDERWPIESKVPARIVERIALQVGKARGQVCGRDPAQIGMNSEPIK